MLLLLRLVRSARSTAAAECGRRTTAATTSGLGWTSSRTMRTSTSTTHCRLQSASSFSTATTTYTQQQKPYKKLYMWGTDTSGSVWKPTNRRDESLLDVPFPIDDTSTTLSLIPNETIQKVVCGPTDTAVLTQTGRLFVSGENKHGQLGLGHSNPVLVPTELVLR